MVDGSAVLRSNTINYMGHCPQGLASYYSFLLEEQSQTKIKS